MRVAPLRGTSCFNRSVSFRFVSVGFDAGRPLVSDTSFWGVRSNVPIQWLPRTHWADWPIRQEGSTPVVIHLDNFPPTNFNLLLRATVLLYLFFFKIEQQYHLHILANIGFEYEYEPLDELIATPPFTRCACYYRLPVHLWVSGRVALLRNTPRLSLSNPTVGGPS